MLPRNKIRRLNGTSFNLEVAKRKVCLLPATEPADVFLFGSLQITDAAQSGKPRGSPSARFCWFVRFVVCRSKERTFPPFRGPLHSFIQPALPLKALRHTRLTHFFADRATFLSQHVFGSSLTFSPCARLPVFSHLVHNHVMHRDARNDHAAICRAEMPQS